MLSEHTGSPAALACARRCLAFRKERDEMGRVRPCQPRGARRKNFMARIAGVNIPTNKRVVIALTYIHGIGSTKAKEITEKLGIAPERRVQDLTDQDVLQIRETIDAEIGRAHV